MLSFRRSPGGARVRAGELPLQSGAHPPVGTGAGVPGSFSGRSRCTLYTVRLNSPTGSRTRWASRRGFRATGFATRSTMPAITCLATSPLTASSPPSRPSPFAQVFPPRRYRSRELVKAGFYRGSTSRATTTACPLIPGCPTAPWPEPRTRLPTGKSRGGVHCDAFHRGIVNCLYMDGRVQAIRDSVDLALWRAIATRNGGEVVSTDSP